MRINKFAYNVTFFETKQINVSSLKTYNYKKILFYLSLESLH